MSISTAMGAALSGLTASGRTAEAISTNIANALSENFGRRELTLSSEVLGGYGSGVTVGPMQRAEDVIATASRRAMGSLSEYSNHLTGALSRITTSIGDPGTTGSLPNLYTAFEGALTAVADNPSSTTHLDTVVARGRDIATALNDQSSTNAQIRMDADREIARQVAKINENLAELDRINVEIRKRYNSPNDITALQDTQHRLIDEISEVVPVKIAKRDFGEIAVFTPQGGVLLDGSVRPIGFAATPFISHAMTIGNGALSGLTQNGAPVAIGGGTGFFDGGSLSALFEIRDVVVPNHNAQLDALARDLIERYQSAAVDPTLLPGDAGLFTDGGATFTAANELGVAERISVNALADPIQGGSSWRLRDGLNAVVQGDVGQNAILRNLESAMGQANTPGPNLGISTPMSAAGFAAELASQRFTDHNHADEKASFAASQVSVLKSAELSSIGVDSDEQLQRLLETEKAYSANARVISVLDGLMEDLLRI